MIIQLIGLLGLSIIAVPVLAVLQLVGVISIGWVWVFAPIWGWFVVALAAGIAVLLWAIGIAVFAAVLALMLA